ncbi:MAG: hypothetical protein HC942_07730 [Microcoleus sp. SU_5_6]|nr:hypothetical protein [Microcoleus sp. SU_5_6]NJL66551.1 hypothetical protein [Microcoleus sp. SM1_3_4]
MAVTLVPNVNNRKPSSAGVTVSPTSVSAAEGGASGSYTVRLNSQPSSPVTVSFNAGTQVNVITSLTFNDTNWNVPPKRLGNFRSPQSIGVGTRHCRVLRCPRST